MTFNILGTIDLLDYDDQLELLHDRLTSLPIDTIQDYMLKCNDILEYNHKHLLAEHSSMPERVDNLLEKL